MSEWDRLPNESSRAYQAYVIYRDLGPDRSLAQVSQKHTKSIPTLKRWSSKYNWVERARAYDDYLFTLKSP